MKRFLKEMLLAGLISVPLSIWVNAPWYAAISIGIASMLLVGAGMRS